MCPDCHSAAIAVGHTASAVRHLGAAGAVSIAAAAAIAISHKRELFGGSTRSTQLISGPGPDQPGDNVNADLP
jgi:hypothetical protein